MFMFSWKRFSRVCNLYTLENYTPNDAAFERKCIFQPIMFVIHINFGGCTIMPTSCWVEDGEALHWRQNERSFPQEWSYIESCQSQWCLTIGRCHFWLLSKKKSLYQNAPPNKLFNAQMLHVWNIYLHLDQIYGMQVNYSMHAAYGMLFLQGLIVI